MLAASLIFYVFSSIFSLLIIYRLNIKQKKLNIQIIFPVVFILIHSLYVIPLPLRCLSDSVWSIVSDGSSPLLLAFVDYLPFAIYFSSIFNILFSFSFYIFAPKIYRKVTKVKDQRINSSFWLIYLAFFIVSLGILIKFAQDSGGLLGLILSGYHVTEKFVGHSESAIAFDWIMLLIVLLYAIASTQQNKKLYLAAVVLIFIVSVSFLIMGRRGVLVVFAISILFIYHTNIKQIKAIFFIVFLVFGFIGLNIIGLIRGDEYSDALSVMDTISTKIETQNNDGTLSNNFLYTLTHGNFIAPYETFPQVIRGFGEMYFPGFGSYSISSLFLLIPNFIWTDRPLPLSNWYMQIFYGQTAMNEGRQFYILTSFYMDLGFLGVMLGAIFIGILLAWLSRLSTLCKNSPILFTAITLVLGSMLNIVANDLFGWMVVYVKTVLAPLFLIALVSRIYFRRRM